MLKRASLLLVAVCICFLPGCSPSGISGGGSETGNPAVLACLTSAFQLGDTLDSWLPSEYLVNGITQLNPGYVCSQPSAEGLSKRLNIASDSTNSYPVDTFIFVDTAFVRDTIFDSQFEFDTLSLTVGWGINNQVIKNLIRDTIFRNDTVLVKDTVYRPRSDKSSGGGSNITVYSRAFTGDTVYLTTTPNLIRRSDTMAVNANRKTTVSNVIINEVYSDGDGDNLLYLNKSAVSPQSWLRATYTSPGSITELDVLFDGGADKLFSSVSDNEIHTLKRVTTRSGVTVENILYRADYNSFNSDTSVLSVFKKIDNDSIESYTDRFACIPGADPDNHYQNRLYSVERLLSYKNRSFSRIDLLVIPDSLIADGQLFVSAHLSAMVNFGKGKSGELDGKLDYLSGVFNGTYYTNGIEYHVRFDRKDGNLEIGE